MTSIRSRNTYDSNWINWDILRRKPINKGFFGDSLRFTADENSGRINKNDFAPQNGL